MSDEDDEIIVAGDDAVILTDGGTDPDPIVLDVDVEGDQVLASVERGDLDLVLSAPVGVRSDEIEDALRDVPETIDRTIDLFVDGGRSA